MKIIKLIVKLIGSLLLQTLFLPPKCLGVALFIVERGAKIIRKTIKYFIKQIEGEILK